MGKKIGVLLIIVSLVLIGLGGYMYYFNPKKVMLETIANQFEKFNITETKKEKTKISTKGKLTFSELGQNMIFDLSGDAYVDSESSKFYANYVTKLDNQVLASPELYFENNKLYLRIKEYLDKLYYIEVDPEDNAKNITQEELDELLSVLGNSIVNNVEEKSFSSKKETITINKNSLKTTKYTVSLKAIELYNVFNEFLTEIKNNSKLKNVKDIVFQSVSETTYSSELKKTIIGDEKEDRILFDYSIYVFKKNQIVKHEIIYKTLNSNKQIINNKIMISNYEKQKDIKDYQFIIQSDNKNIFELVIDSSSSSDNNIKILSDEIAAEGKLTKSDKNEVLKLDFFASDDKTNPIATLNYKNEEIKKNLEYKSNIDFNLKLLGNSIVLSFENTVYKNQEVPKFDTSKAEKFNLDSTNFNMLNM